MMIRCASVAIRHLKGKKFRERERETQKASHTNESRSAFFTFWGVIEAGGRLKRKKDARDRKRTNNLYACVFLFARVCVCVTFEFSPGN